MSKPWKKSSRRDRSPNFIVLPIRMSHWKKGLPRRLSKPDGLQTAGHQASAQIAGGHGRRRQQIVGLAVQQNHVPRQRRFTLTGYVDSLQNTFRQAKSEKFVKILFSVRVYCNLQNTEGLLVELY